jgi:hypothetical protein
MRSTAPRRPGRRACGQRGRNGGRAGRPCVLRESSARGVPGDLSCRDFRSEPRRGVQLAERPLDADLDACHRTDKNGPVRVLDQGRRLFAKPLGHGEHPEKGMGVEEIVHASVPKKSAERRGSSSSKSGAMWIFPSNPPRGRFSPAGLNAVSLAIGFPCLPKRITSPAATRSSNRERCVFASWTLITFTKQTWSGLDVLSKGERLPA